MAALISFSEKTRAYVDLLCDELKKMCRFELKSKMCICNVHVTVYALFRSIQFSLEQLYDGSILYFSSNIALFVCCVYKLYAILLHRCLLPACCPVRATRIFTNTRVILYETSFLF